MIEVMPESHENFLALRVTGKLTDQDYMKVFIPRLEDLIRTHGKARVLLYADEGYRGIEWAAVRDDVRFGLRHRNDFLKVAIVGAPRWVDWTMKVSSWIMEGEVKTFPAERLWEAGDWCRN